MIQQYCFLLHQLIDAFMHQMLYTAMEIEEEFISATREIQAPAMRTVVTTMDQLLLRHPSNIVAISKYVSYSHRSKVCLYSVRDIYQLSQRTDKLVSILHEHGESENVMQGYAHRLELEEAEVESADESSGGSNSGSGGSRGVDEVGALMGGMELESGGEGEGGGRRLSPDEKEARTSKCVVFVLTLILLYSVLVQQSTFIDFFLQFLFYFHLPLQS